MSLRNITISCFKGIENVTLSECGGINAIIGKNNSGKSTILHALDLFGLAVNQVSWHLFQPKLKIKDLFPGSEDFSMQVALACQRDISICLKKHHEPVIEGLLPENEALKMILITPEGESSILNRQQRAPNAVMNYVESREYHRVNGLDILFAIKFYSQRRERNFSPESFASLIDCLKRHFPDIEQFESDKDENDIATLSYLEYGRWLDVFYSGAGLKHFLDILIKVAVSNANIVLLDEPEAGLHPDLQRRLMEYLRLMVERDGLQFFLATHSPVLLNHADSITFFRIENRRGCRTVSRVQSDRLEALLSDLGIRPSDLFGQDICLMVEGATEIIFFEHILKNLYRDEFKGVAVGVIQYGGSAVEGIVNGSIDVSNIVATQKHILWTHDKDTPESCDQPSPNATKLKNALFRHQLTCHIWRKREIEFYFPLEVHEAAQQGDEHKEAATKAILQGDQTKKYTDAGKEHGVCVPKGSTLRKLLREHLTQKDQLDQEVRSVIEEHLIPWTQEILGIETPTSENDVSDDSLRAASTPGNLN